MLNQLHHLGPNNKLTSDTEYTQKFTNYPNDIIEFDILSGEQLPYMEVSIIKVGEPTPIAIPTIGQKWDGEINQFVNP
jgi:hypothetical protein